MVYAQNRMNQKLMQNVASLRLLITPNEKKLSEIVADEMSHGHSGGRVEDKQSLLRLRLPEIRNFVSLSCSDVMQTSSEPLRLYDTSFMPKQMIGERDPRR